MRAYVLAALATAFAADRADAFCGFYVGGAGAKMFNNATEVVLMRHGTTTVLSMQNNYQGPPEHFAMVVPVPTVIKEAQVKTLPRDVFEKVDVLGAPRLVEYWEEDPCFFPKYEVEDEEADMAPAAKRSADDGDDDSRDVKEYHVKVEAKFSVGEYDIEVLSAQQSTGLDHWLRDHKYTIPEGAEPLLRPYVEAGTKWFVAKVDPKKVKFTNGMATLSPLRFHYDSPEFNLPIRLGLANSQGTQDLIVNILAPKGTRYEVANYPNATIPTNLIVNDAVRTRFGEFYAALFDHVLEKVPHAVVTEYAWQANNCDPCPGPVLDGNDLATFGADVIESQYKDVDQMGFTLTRLHARYGKDVGNDLVFRAVNPIVGGRGIPDATGEVSTKVVADSANNFQGRYIILHPWAGAITCAQPARGRWGDTAPAGQQQIATQTATNLAFQPRGNVQLAALVAKDVPAIGVMSSKGFQLPPPARKPQGCGCRAQGGASTAVVGALVGVVALRRRRRRTHHASASTPS
jgi:MYXO-CTERM domain-containing protein